MRVLLKLSGEAFSSKDSSLDLDKINHYIEEIKKVKDNTNSEIGIVVGGGNFFRGRNAKELGLDREKLDYMGMLGTVMNAICLSEKLNLSGVKAKALSLLNIDNAIEKYDSKKANEYLSEGYTLVFGGGTGKPFFSTDTASLLRAIDINAKMVLMAKNGVDGVYSNDPKIDKNAVKYDILSSKDIIDKKLNVMDLDAAKIAYDNDIDIFVFNIDNKDAIYNAVLGKEKGTIIKKEI